MLATNAQLLSFHSLLHNNVQCLLQEEEEEEEEALLLLLQCLKLKVDNTIRDMS